MRFFYNVSLSMNDSEHLSPPSETMSFVQPVEQGTPVPIPAPALLPAGTTLGHYVIKRYIGGGGMGRVYLAADTALDRDVAVKVLTQQRSNDQGTAARFMNEARSAARLNHEHIAQVYFAGEESGVPFIAFEYVEGTNVRIMVEEKGIFSLPQALNYLLQISHALAHATSHGVVHRDVKPSNILITRDGRAKLIDMGLARLLDTKAIRDDLTASGVTLGTFDYISPEQARDPRFADIRSDIYSLGCTLFFMLAGRPPFPEGTVLQKLLQHQGDAPPDIRSFQPTIPAEISFLIQKMMAKDPKQRFQTPTLLIEALTNVAQRLGLRLAGQGKLVWTPARSTRTSILLRHLPWITAVSLLLFGFFLMTILDERSKKPLPVSELNPTAPPKAANVPPPPPEPPETHVLSFDVAFVSYSATSAKPFHGLRSQRVGGGLQPAWEGASHTQERVSGRLNVADLLPANQNTTAQRPGQRTRIRCVDPTGNTSGSYRSLAAALTDAEDGTRIELKWNHNQRIQESIQLDRRKLQIVAAKGYDPILLFEPSLSQNARSLFTVFSGNIDFEKVGIEIRLNRNLMVPHWSLFELTGNTRLMFEKCCLTVRNTSPYDDTAYHDDVVFFRNGIPEVIEGAVDVRDPLAEPLVIHLTDSLLRGEAMLIQSKVPQDIHIQCTNSFIALAKPFLLAEESRRVSRQATIQIRWDKVAFFGRQGIVHLFKEATATPLIVDFESKNSIFVLNRSAFAVFRGIQTQKEALENFKWSGGGTDNYFQGVSGLRFRTSPVPPDAGTVVEMPLDDWRQHWTQEMKDRTKIDTLSMSEINKAMSQFLPSNDVRLPFDSPGRVAMPDTNWFPSLWNLD
jgi:serine/threonine-protein kinase